MHYFPYQDIYLPQFNTYFPYEGFYFPYNNTDFPCEAIYFPYHNTYFPYNGIYGRASISPDSTRLGLKVFHTFLGKAAFGAYDLTVPSEATSAAF